MTIIVTGASGHLGGLIVDGLLRRGIPADQIVATGRNVDALTRFSDQGITVRHADFDEPDTLAAAFAGGTRLVLVSGSELGKRATQHAHAIAAARQAGIELIAYTSIPHADTTTMLLAAEHLATEKELAASGVPFVLLRNSWYLENYTAQLGTYLAHGIVGSAGTGRISAAARADYAEAAVAVVAEDGHAGAVYELGGADFSLPELADAITAATGTTVTYTDLPVAAFEQVLVDAGLPAPAAHVFADVDRGIARGELLVETGDLEKLIGHPATTLTEALSAQPSVQTQP